MAEACQLWCKGAYSFAQMNTHFYPVDTIICYLAVITSRYDLCSGSSLHSGAVGYLSRERQLLLAQYLERRTMERRKLEE